ncbi:hypothetical protein D6D03_03314 [Aureobasidium pullulans]|nr:hypothetical protein D6D03_03314 [Aureobasidium pullulans]
MDLTGLDYDDEAANFVHEHPPVPDASRGRPLTPEEANEAKRLKLSQDNREGTIDEQESNSGHAIIHPGENINHILPEHPVIPNNRLLPATPLSSIVQSTDVPHLQATIASQIAADTARNDQLQAQNSEIESLSTQLDILHTLNASQSQEIKRLQEDIHVLELEETTYVTELHKRLDERDKLSTKQSTDLANTECELADLEGNHQLLLEEKTTWSAKTYTLQTRLERIKTTNRHLRKLKNVKLIEDLHGTKMQMYGLLKDREVFYKEQIQRLEDECDGWQEKAIRLRIQRNLAEWKIDEGWSREQPPEYEEGYWSDEEGDEGWKEKSKELMRKWMGSIRVLLLPGGSTQVSEHLSNEGRERARDVLREVMVDVTAKTIIPGSTASQSSNSFPSKQLSTGSP